MRILLYSDLHLEFAPFTPPDIKADVVVLAGDIHVGVKGIEWAAKTFGPTPVVYVAGNHEYYRQSFPEHLAKMRAAAKGTHVRFLENDCTVIDGTVFFGTTLWTDFNLYGNPIQAMREAQLAMNDYHVIRWDATGRRLRAEDTLSLHKESAQWLKDKLQAEMGKPVVIVTHHAPSLQSVSERYKRDIVSAAFASPLDRSSPLLARSFGCMGMSITPSTTRLPTPESFAIHADTRTKRAAGLSPDLRSTYQTPNKWI